MLYKLFIKLIQPTVNSVRIRDMCFNVIIPFVLYWAKIILNQIAVRMTFRKREKEREREREDGNTCESTLSFLHSTDIIGYIEIPNSLLSSCE